MPADRATSRIFSVTELMVTETLQLTRVVGSVPAETMPTMTSWHCLRTV